MVKPTDLQNLIYAVIGIAEQASAQILKIYESDFAIQRKDDKTPLTEADMAAHNTIVAGLTALKPDWPVLSEESANVDFSVRGKWKRYWLVDPLDGTREFIKRNGEFTVNIALIENGQTILGVVHVPVTGVCYYAAKGAGAFKTTPGQVPVAIKTRSVDTSKFKVAGSRSHADPHIQSFLQRLGNYELVSMGSSLKTCLIAEGLCDVYPRFGLTSEWDTAAAQCVLEEAGGLLTDTKLTPLRYNTKDSLLNPHFIAFGDTGFDWAKYIG